MYIGSPSLGFSHFDRYVRPPVPINDGVPARGGNWHETETMYIKHIVSLIRTGGLAYLPEGENWHETEPMYIKHSVLLMCLMYRGYPSLGFSPFDRYARPPVPINDTLCLMYIASAALGF
jgi:hypothetical protein